MKTKAILFVGVAALATLSFTFANTSASKSPNSGTKVATDQAAPIGGFVAEEVAK